VQVPVEEIAAVPVAGAVERDERDAAMLDNEVPYRLIVSGCALLSCKYRISPAWRNGRTAPFFFEENRLFGLVLEGRFWHRFTRRRES
jgi:hypothetical protein